MRCEYRIRANPGQVTNQDTSTWAPSQYPKRRLIERSREVSKSRDLYLELSDRSEIWQALRQHCCRCACQISKRYYNLKYQYRGFETSRDLTIRRFFGYWDGALGASLGLLSWCPILSQVTETYLKVGYLIILTYKQNIFNILTQVDTC